MAIDKKIPVSVLMSCYNAELWIKSSIDSILGQTFEDFEFIIIDDGSTDRTSKIIEEYANRDGRIVWIRKANTGLADSLNVGLRRARGEWIARLDADDISDRERLHAQLQCVRDNPGVILVGSWSVEIDELGNRIKMHRYPEWHRMLSRNLQSMKRFFPHSSAFYNTERVRAIGGYNLRAGKAEDLHLWQQLCIVGEIRCLQKPLVCVRRHRYQISFSDGGVQQYVDALAATVALNLRSRFGNDPIGKLDDQSWTRLRVWIEEEIRKSSAVSRFVVWRRLREEVIRGETGLRQVIKGSLDLVWSGHAWGVLHEQVWGSTEPRRIAQEWIRLNELSPESTKLRDVETDNWPFASPVVSVLMCCFNGERWVGEAIESVLCQTFLNFEFIIIDDGSVDKSWGIIEKAAKRDDRIVAVRRTHRGLTDSLNFGIALARGSWVARLDADDLCEPRRLEEQVAYVAKHPEIVLLGSGFTEVDEDGKLVMRHSYPRAHRRLLQRLVRMRACFPHSSALFKRSVLNELGNYNPLFIKSQDKDLWLRMATYGEIACGKRKLVVIRGHEGQVTRMKEGISQTTFAVAATVCYLLRMQGKADPSAGIGGHSWTRFIQWLEKRLAETGFSTRRELWENARKRFLQSSGGLLRYIAFGVQLFRTGYFLSLVTEYFIGSSVARQLTKEWSSTSVTNAIGR